MSQDISGSVQFGSSGPQVWANPMRLSGTLTFAKGQFKTTSKLSSGVAFSGAFTCKPSFRSDVAFVGLFWNKPKVDFVGALKFSGKFAVSGEYLATNRYRK